MTSKIGILYGRPSRTTEGTWSEEPEGGVYQKETPEYIASMRKDDHRFIDEKIKSPYQIMSCL